MLRNRRKEIIAYVNAHREFIMKNAEALNIYEGNLLPYIDSIMQKSLSPRYYETIRDRILPINILQRFVDKVSTTYSKAPRRESESVMVQEFVDYYSERLHMNQSGQIADAYSNLFKGFAWEPYVDKNGNPAMRELPYDSFLVMSDSVTNPEEETIFIKFMGKKGDSEDSMLLHVYTDDEFDAFYMSGDTEVSDLIENEGINVIGKIPFVYGKRQKNRLLPVQDSDMLKITKAIPVMISDAAGAQMYQCFSILYGIDLNIENASMSPNVFWNIKSDGTSDRPPQIGTIKPEADTDKVLSFVVSVFTLWLETKGIRIGSLGSLDASNMASGISKIIDEMDVSEIKKKSQEWFEKDEQELWNEKLPYIHNYWIKSGLINPAQMEGVPGLMAPFSDSEKVHVEFEEPKPMQSRQEIINEIKSEIDLGTMTLEQAIKRLHPEYDEKMIAETLAGRVLQ
jgi:hypothetical protein